jgi:4-amino-4-deoxy-L-arabinose transferase-like glycosyltransferase
MTTFAHRVTAPAAAEAGSPALLRAWPKGLWFAVIGSAFLVRILWALRIPISPVSDCHAYDTFARNLANGLVYGFDGISPSAYWPVGTSFMYSLVYRIFDPEQWGYGPIAALNILVGVAIVVLGMELGRRWFGRAVGLATGAILAVWPLHVQFSTVIASEQIFTLLCIAGVLAWAEPGDRRGLARACLAGVIFAAATYVRPTAALLPLVLAGSAWLRGCSFRSASAQAALAVMIMAVLVAPWSVRNTRAFGQFVVVSTNGGANLWMGNNPETTGHYMDLPEMPPEFNEAQVDTQLGREARQYIMEQPLAFAVRTVVKAVRLHERETIGIVWNEPSLQAMMGPGSLKTMKIASQAYWVVALLAGLCGAAILASRWRYKAAVHPAIAIWGYFTAVHAVIVIQDRYHFPATPVIASLAALAFIAAWQRRLWGHPDTIAARPEAST